MNLNDNSKNVDKKEEIIENQELTKPELHIEADEDMIRSATKRALANDWKDPEFKRAKKIFKEDESIKDKSIRAFIEWMVKNVSSETYYNVVRKKLTYKELFLFEEGKSASNRKDVVEL